MPIVTIRKAVGSPPRASILAIADAAEAQMKAQLRRALQELSEGFTLLELAEAQLARNAQGFVTQLPWLEFRSELLATTDTLRGVLEAAGTETFKDLFPAASNLGASFSVRDPNVQSYIRDRSSILITNVTDQTRQAVRETLTRAFDEGWGGPREIARRLRSTIGLDVSQARALARFREAQKDPEGRLSTVAEKRIDRQAARYLKQRTERIARTELLSASNVGQMESMRQAIDAGYMGRSTVNVRWLVAPDDRLCLICNSLAGSSVGFGESFETTIARATLPPITYTAQQPPIHVNCRCTVYFEFS